MRERSRITLRGILPRGRLKAKRVYKTSSPVGEGHDFVLSSLYSRASFIAHRTGICFRPVLIPLLSAPNPNTPGKWSEVKAASRTDAKF
jgi:hypothetical protein